MSLATAASPKRNKSFDETHRDLIETSVRLISERSVAGLSVAALARATGLNRTTIYYHFENRDALLDAVKLWSSEQLSKGLSAAAPQQERIDHITRFVLENPELLKLWIDEFVSPGDIRARYPFWDVLVEGVAATGGDIDAEIFCVLLLTSAIIGPRVFKNSVRPQASADDIAHRFRREEQRWLRQNALLSAE
jgi:AcrR family transcriptional regulator